MERLTGRNEKGELLFDEEQVYAGKFYEAASALEEYENTGLTPEQVRELQERQRWIPVSERLPEKEKFYLVTFVKYSGEYDIEYCYFECGKWFIVADGENIGWREEMKSVVAWMPLPEPYSPEGV